MELNVKPVRPGAVLPHYGSAGAAGLDLSACIDEPVTIRVGASVMIPSGVAIALPAGTVGLLVVRSSLGVRHGVGLPNGVGVIDEDYRGEVSVALMNLGGEAYTVQPGDRIAQLIVSPYIRADVTVAQQLEETARGAGGFGSTGR